MEYVLYKNNNVLSKNYAEKIAASLAREGVTTTVDAMNYLKKLTVKSTAKKKTTVKESPVKEDDSEISLDEMNDLLNELEVKKNEK